MRLAAVFIIEHYLFDEPQCLNIIGNYFYSFKIEYKKIIINRVINSQYVDNLHSNNITELSAIVGANGSGKTTLLSIINKEHDSTRTIFIYEDENHDIKVVNRTGMLDENGYFTERSQIPTYFNDTIVYSVPNIDIPTLYYSPIPDEDLSDVSSSVSKTTHFKSTLIEYHLDNIERSIMLMTDDVVDEIKKAYPELPLYNYLSLSAKPLYKRDLRNIYAGFKVEGDIEKSQKISLDNLWKTYPNTNEKKEHLTHESSDFYKNIEINLLSYILIDGTSMETAFNGKYEISFNDIIKEKNINKKLKHLFFHKIAYIDKYFYYSFKELLTGYDYSVLLSHLGRTNFDEELKEKQSRVISTILNLKNSVNNIPIEELRYYFEKKIELLINDELRGAEFESFRENLISFNDYLSVKFKKNQGDLLEEISRGLEEVEFGINKSFEAIFKSRLEIIDQLENGVRKAIKLFAAIQDFYNGLGDFVKKDGVDLVEGEININLSVIDFIDFKDLIQKYKSVIVEFNGNNLINAQILEFRPDKKLSFGEKSLLNLFSSFYEFTLKKNDYLRRKEHYIILLDEADLGFHPLWKKKFISAISTVIPIIFEKLNEDIDNSNTSELEKRKTQIIISTHDPLTLSDIPNYNIVYIDKLVNGKSDVLNILDDNSYRPKQSFGANVHDLLANSFFLKGGFMGEFAKKYITSLIDEVNNIEIINSEKEFNSYVRKINIIDEPFFKYKLIESLESKYSIKKHNIDSLIEKKERELKELKRKKENDQD